MAYPKIDSICSDCRNEFDELWCCTSCEAWFCENCICWEGDIAPCCDLCLISYYSETEHVSGTISRKLYRLATRHVDWKIDKSIN